MESSTKPNQDLLKAFDENRSELTRLSNSFNELDRKQKFIMNILRGYTDTSDETIHTGHPFSYYRGPEWKSQIDTFMKDAPLVLINRMSISAGPANDNADFNQPNNDLQIDDIIIHGIENYNFQNGGADTVTVSAPGLNDLKDNTLKIDGDKEVDHVVLDGCLKWVNQPDESDFIVLKAIDADQESRVVKIRKGLDVRTEVICDNRYLIKAGRNIVSDLIKGKIGDAPPEPFGGVGLRLRPAQDGLLVDKVYPNSPAEAAGLLEGDQLINIDDQPVSSMSFTAATLKLRGTAGTSVKVTYKTPSLTSNQLKTVIITRQMIDLRNK